eukprot:GHVQ01043472.1.p1 GENE.GHVQ01043472.1~~GHVQ01043472.1.p1  ORF type:complete len:854 (+),score=99.03 GHVQ01043472.1:888-3449(+)
MGRGPFISHSLLLSSHSLHPRQQPVSLFVPPVPSSSPGTRAFRLSPHAAHSFDDIKRYYRRLIKVRLRHNIRIHASGTAQQHLISRVSRFSATTTTGALLRSTTQSQRHPLTTPWHPHTPPSSLHGVFPPYQYRRLLPRSRVSRSSGQPCLYWSRGGVGCGDINGELGSRGGEGGIGGEPEREGCDEKGGAKQGLSDSLGFVSEATADASCSLPVAASVASALAGVEGQQRIGQPSFEDDKTSGIAERSSTTSLDLRTPFFPPAKPMPLVHPDEQGTIVERLTGEVANNGKEAKRIFFGRGESYEALGLDPVLCYVLNTEGIDHSSAIQASTIPHLINPPPLYDPVPPPPVSEAASTQPPTEAGARPPSPRRSSYCTLGTIGEPPPEPSPTNDHCSSPWLGLPPRALHFSSSGTSPASFSDGLPAHKFVSRKIPKDYRRTSRNEDLIIAAETGSGKTLAYLLPMLHRVLKLQKSRSGNDEGKEDVREEEGSGDTEGKVRSQWSPFGLILVPNRELAQQVHSWVLRLTRNTPHRPPSPPKKFLAHNRSSPHTFTPLTPLFSTSGPPHNLATPSPSASPFLPAYPRHKNPPRIDSTLTGGPGSGLGAISSAALWGSLNTGQWPFGPHRDLPPDVLICTPNFLTEHVRGGGVKDVRPFADLQMIVVDEADMLLDGAYKEDLVSLLRVFTMVDRANVKAGRTRTIHRNQIVLSAATLPDSGERSIKRFLEGQFPKAKLVQTNMLHKQLPQLRQEFVKLSDVDTETDRLVQLIRCLSDKAWFSSRIGEGRKLGKTIVFCNTVDSAKLASKTIQDHMPSLNTLAYHAVQPSLTNSAARIVRIFSDMCSQRPSSSHRVDV